MADAARFSSGRGRDPALNLASAIFRHAALRPSAPALRIGDRTWSYAELAAGAARVAERLGQGASTMRRTARVGVLASRSFEAYSGILGISCVGGAYVPINPKQPASRIASIIARAGLSALVVDDGARAHLSEPEVRASLPEQVLAGIVPSAGTDRSAPGPAAVAPDDVAYVMFTSGTTGVPKGVVVTTANVAHFLEAVRARYAIGPDDRVGQFCETSFDVSVFEMFAAWDGGACLCVVPDSQLMAPAGFIRREALTVWTSVPSVVSMMSRMKLLEPGLFPSLRVSFFIGEALSSKSAREWQAAAPSSVVDNQYGPTEATVACTVQRISEPLVETPGRGTVAIGTPYDGLHADIVDENGAFLPDGTTGELVVAGPQLAAGYLDDPDQTAQRFPTLDHPRLGSLRWYRTGDLAFRDPDGILHCLGRTDHQVKILGHRVELEDLEAHLRSASGSDAVAAIAWPVTDGVAAAVAAFVCGGAAPAAEIRARLRRLVPAYMVPRIVVELDALPLSANGKIDRNALRAMLEQRSPGSGNG